MRTALRENCERVIEKVNKKKKKQKKQKKQAVACPKLLHMHKKDQIFHSVNSKKLK